MRAHAGSPAYLHNPAGDGRFVCCAYRNAYDIPCAEVVVYGTFGRARARAQRLLAANRTYRLVEVFQGEECLVRLTKEVTSQPGASA